MRASCYYVVYCFFVLFFCFVLFCFHAVSGYDWCRHWQSRKSRGEKRLLSGTYIYFYYKPKFYRLNPFGLKSKKVMRNVWKKTSRYVVISAKITASPILFNFSRKVMLKRRRKRRRRKRRKKKKKKKTTPDYLTLRSARELLHVIRTLLTRSNCLTKTWVGLKFLIFKLVALPVIAFQSQKRILSWLDLHYENVRGSIRPLQEASIPKHAVPHIIACAL